jgi:glycosyltransferase involved in cell wall biosynthesis
MRICLASMHPRVLSGQIDSLAGLGRGLAHRGHDVTLVAPFEADGPPAADLLARNLTELDTGPRGLLAAARSMAAAVPRLVRRAQECELVHLALPTPAFGWLADVVRRHAGVPVVAGFEAHLASPGQLRRAWQRPATLRTYLPLCGVNNRLFSRLGGRRCEAYVVSSDYQREELLSLGFPPERVTVLANAVEDGKLLPCEPRLARRRLGLPPRRPVVGYLGHFNDVKGVDVLAAAFRDVAAALPGAVLALAWSGQGDARPVRERLAGLEDRVVWLEKVHVGTFLSAVDALALPYRSTAGQGAYPSLVLEALHAGTPLVTTDLPLLREITSRGDVALDCPPERADLLAANVVALLGSEARRAEMAWSQRQVTRAAFSHERLIPRYEALYAAVLGAAVAERSRPLRVPLAEGVRAAA